LRRSTCCLLVVLFGSWLSSFGQSAPKLTSPKIVATFERLNQTARIGQTTIYTPKTWGTFRVSIIMVGTVANGSNQGDWESDVQVFDAAGAYNFGCQITTSIRQTNSVEVPVRVRAGKPITFAVNAQGNTDGAQYNVWVVVEQLM
jgi:hypothetical protein